MDFNKLVKQNRANVKSIIRLITKEDNEDLEQEVYLKVWKNSDKYKEQGTFKSWINTVAKNVSKDYLKSSYRKHQDKMETDDTVLNTVRDRKDSPELTVVKNERQKTILVAINALKPKMKEVVLMCEIYGYTYEDCAKKLKCPVGTVKSRLFNAKKELAETLKDLL